ncbi:MAG: hypothetical protein ABR611_13930 [Chthoniobacterales bacterium]
MENRPPEKRLEVAPFAVHATRGVLRDPKARRKTMALLLAGAVVLIALGLFGAKTWLEPHEHPVRFISFWFACGWITLTALLLALLDLLVLRTAARQARKALREEMAEPAEVKSEE